MERTQGAPATSTVIPRYSPAPSTPVAAIAPATIAVLNPVMLLVDDAQLTADYVPSLRRNFRVTAVSTVAAAVAAIERDRPAIVVTEAELADGSAAMICTAAKRFDPPATVLVVTDKPATIPDLLTCGCDAVLLKPFAPNLLYARIGRLMRDRSRDLRMRAHFRKGDGSLASERCGGTNRFWPDAHCPQCNKAGVTSFEFASHRRAWFACTACRQAWIGRRLEEF
jgi:DNA-binding response OmpR family regulator